MKLTAAVSAWLGMGHAVVFILSTAVAGGLLALGYLALRRGTGEALSRMARTIRLHLAVGLRPIDPGGRSVQFPYTLAIASGALFVFLSVSTAFWR